MEKSILVAVVPKNNKKVRDVRAERVMEPNRDLKTVAVVQALFK